MEKLLCQFINRFSESLLDENYANLFQEGDPKQGVLRLLNAGQVYVNGKPIPAKESDGEEFRVNGELIFAKLPSGSFTWMPHPIFRDHTGEGLDFDGARLAFFDALCRLQGWSWEVLDTDGSGFAGKLSITLKSGGAVTGVKENGDSLILTGSFGYGGEDAKPLPEITVEKKNVFGTIRPGDLALFWWEVENGEEALHIDRPMSLTGHLTGHEGEVLDGKDVFNGIAYPQALIARHFMPDGTRNAQFGEKHLTQKERPVVMWLTEFGFPFGYTYLKEEGTR